MSLYLGENYLTKNSTLDDPIGFTGMQFLTNQVEEINLTDSYRRTYIPSYFFGNLTNLKRVTLPEKVIELASSSFFNSGIEYANFPYITSISSNGIFKNCVNLKEVNLPNATGSVYMDSFNDCNNLKAIYLNSASTLYNSIENAENLEILYIPSCTSFNSTFKNCGFKTFTFSNKITSNLPIVLFNNCKNLESIYIEDGATFTIPSRIIYQCPNFKSIYIPSTITTIDTNAFLSVTNAFTIYIDKPKDSITGAPWGATNATVIWKG